MSAFSSLRVGAFLALRFITRSNRYVLVLIITILMLIFLNLVAIGGLLLGLIKGSELGYIKTYSGTLLIEPLRDEKYIKSSLKIIDFAKTIPGFKAYSLRLSAGVTIEKDYRQRKVGTKGNSIGATLVGMDPLQEAETTNLASKVVEGRFLQLGDRDVIVLGSILAGRGATIAIGESLQDVYIGEKVQVTFSNGLRREYTIIGITKTKSGLRNLQAFITLDEMNDVLNIRDNRVSEIALKTDDPLHAEKFKQFFVNAGYQDETVLKTWDESLGSAIKDVNDSFELIGNIIGGIGLMVGGITIFILIFVNAVSKRRFIGILKASGITKTSIILSYVFQGIFYTIISTVLGLILLFGFLIPYVDKNPIDFPFADGILYASTDYVMLRIIILFAVSIISGFVPAYLIVKENTLNAILGR